jgi:hypothetical protein
MEFTWEMSKNKLEFSMEEVFLLKSSIMASFKVFMRDGRL